MLSTIPAKKLGMTSVFDGAGTTMPATILEPFDLYVVQKKTVMKDGYSALVLAFEDIAEKHVNKPKSGQLKKAGIEQPLKRMFEVKVDESALESFTLGQVIKPEDFLPYWGEATTAGTSKGRGFQGVMRRHNFKGVRMTHGHTIHRKPASGGATDPARQFKGSRRPGHMGSERVTVKNLTVFEYNRLHNILVVQGTVPGPRGGLVWVTRTKELEKEIVDLQYQDYLEAKAEEETSVAAAAEEISVSTVLDQSQEQADIKEPETSETQQPEAAMPDEQAADVPVADASEDVKPESAEAVETEDAEAAEGEVAEPESAEDDAPLPAADDEEEEK